MGKLSTSPQCPVHVQALGTDSDVIFSAQCVHQQPAALWGQPSYFFWQVVAGHPGACSSGELCRTARISALVILLYSLTGSALTGSALTGSAQLAMCSMVVQGRSQRY